MGFSLFLDETVVGLEIVHVSGEVVEGVGVDGARKPELVDKPELSPDHLVEGQAEDLEEVFLAHVLLDDLFPIHGV
jgi:hypothetical protein